MADALRSHQHCDPVVLPDGTTVWAAAIPVHGYERAELPDFGLYLDPLWKPPWPHRHIEWADFGLPADEDALYLAFDEVLQRARAGQMVEVGCVGGHGRTGTSLACLAQLTGLAEDPVQWIRAQYCDRAVETDDQAEFARNFKPQTQ